jgi:hypothetical protein
MSSSGILYNNTSGIHFQWTERGPGYYAKALAPSPLTFIGPPEEWLAEFIKKLNFYEDQALQQKRRSALIGST